MAKVSVCIPTYNRSHYLTYAVNSVLNQTYSDFELIICDDGSPDNTPEVVAGLQDNRIRYIRHEKNIGRSRNMRSGFEASQGDYFIKFDDDDALTPEFLEKTVKILDEKIRPAVAKDGGDIKFKEFKDGIVKVQLQGSCSGCPSSTMTLKQGVQNLLCHYLPEVKQVEAI